MTIYFLFKEATLDSFPIFAKNSWRVNTEPQIITHSTHQKHEEGEEVKCTFETIPQALETNEVLLSQPYWMYGAEMGVNEHEVVIGNEPVYTTETKLGSGLTGQDLVRLGLERGDSAKQSLDVIINLLEKHGQRGECGYDNHQWFFHNSFLIADPGEAFIIETADKWWIAEKLKDFKIKSISNEFTVKGKGDRRRDGIINYAIEKGCCKNEDDFNFAQVFSKEKIPDNFPLKVNLSPSIEILTKHMGEITIEHVIEILRREQNESGNSLRCAGSQISHLKYLKKSIHWFTGGPYPKYNLIKPYIFPVENQKVNNAGPYSKINPEWFWTQNERFLGENLSELKTQKYMNELNAIERELRSEVRNLVHEQDNYRKEDFVKEFEKINQESWEKAYEIISLKPT
ncbi:MAG: peptidase C69 [Candidatus Lokiarchaeota archaeon]|nr:peptidase C69 [Candidatus Lokiarchaeota archaeon]MBD3339713.1 peptidase C69 [Candidatus Lokiarchaeota archaeon]